MAGLDIRSQCVFVYWLFDEKCVCPWRHGYVGISARVALRVARHRWVGKLPPFDYQILFAGTRPECRAVEYKLRPDFNIGWNYLPGGGSRTSIGRTNKGRIGQRKSDEERAKISRSNSGKVRANPRVNARYGNTSHLGHKHSEKTKQTIRMKKIGVPIHSEEEKEKRRQRWKGNSLTKGQPWSAARRLAWLQNK